MEINADFTLYDVMQIELKRFKAVNSLLIVNPKTRIFTLIKNGYFDRSSLQIFY